jgi:hypothetical protein
MQFVYRGIAYQSAQATGETVETGIAAQFLGQRYTVRQSTETARSQPAGLIYRGRPVNALDR